MVCNDERQYLEGVIKRLILDVPDPYQVTGLTSRS